MQTREETIKSMIRQSNDPVTDSPTKRIYEAVNVFQKVVSLLTVRLRKWPVIKECVER